MTHGAKVCTCTAKHSKSQTGNISLPVSWLRQLAKWKSPEERNDKKMVPFHDSENYQTQFHCHIVQIRIFQEQQKADQRPWCLYLQSVLVRTYFWGPRKYVLTNRNYVVKEKFSKSPKSPKFQKYSRYGKICMIHTKSCTKGTVVRQSQWRKRRMLDWRLFQPWNGWFFFVQYEKNVVWGKFDCCTNRNYVSTDYVLSECIKYVSQCLMPDKSWRGMRPGPVTALCISYVLHDCSRTFASCFLCSRVQLTWIFFLWLCYETPLHSCKCVYLPESEKVSLWNSYKSERASSVHH